MLACIEHTGRLELALPELRLLARQPQCAVADRAQRLLRGEAVRRADGDSRGRLVGQAGHAHHEELVQVRGEDRAEVDPRQERQAGLGGDLEHARVEVEPRELSVQKACFDLDCCFRSHERPSSRPV